MRFGPLFAAAVIAAVAPFVPGGAAAETLEQLIARVKPSVVAVGTHQGLRRPPNRFLGTGFAVGDGTLIATSNHVIPVRLDTANNEFLCVFVGTGEGATVIPVRTAASDPFHDVVLLRLARGRLPPLRLHEGDTVAEGAEIAFTGYPIGAVLGLYPVTHRGIISARTPIAIPQITRDALDSRMVRQLRQPFDVLQLDAMAYPGNSGSPLYQRSTGRVVGIISNVFVKESKEALLSRPSGITFAVPIRYVRELLTEVGPP